MQTMNRPSQPLLWYRSCEIFSYRHKFISMIWIVLLVAYSQLIMVNCQQKADEVCETLPSEIHLIKGICLHHQFCILYFVMFVIVCKCLWFH